VVTIFQVKEAREQLLNKGVVITFRAYNDRLKLGNDWATDKRCGKKICNIYKSLIENCPHENMIEVSDLNPYVPLSGFKSLEDWIDAIHKIDKDLMWGEALLVINLDFSVPAKKRNGSSPSLAKGKSDDHVGIESCKRNIDSAFGGSNPPSRILPNKKTGEKT
jgi:hypothetical protein